MGSLREVMFFPSWPPFDIMIFFVSVFQNIDKLKATRLHQTNHDYDLMHDISKYMH